MVLSFFSDTYRNQSTEESLELYRNWSPSYDKEHRDNGYYGADRCASALAKFARDQTSAVLDFGCGTGLSGLALKLAGFATLDGVDLSEEMLAKAMSKRLYRQLNTIGVDEDLPFKPGTYQAIAAVDVIGEATAPIATFDKLVDILPSGGHLVMSLTDHALADRVNQGRLNEWMDCGVIRLLFKEYGPHLRGLDLKSNVYVLEKA